MKNPLLFILACLASPSLYAAVTATSDFSNGLDGFTAITGNTSTDTSSGALVFVASGSNQGSGVSINPTTVLGSSLSSFLLDSSGNPIPDASVFFEFSTIVPADTGSEVGFFLGPVGNNVASDSISPNGANNNLFTLFLHDSGGDIQLSAQNNGQVNNNPNSIGNGTGGEQDILTNLGVGTELTISIELSIVNGANNGIASTYIVTATGTDDAGNPVIATGSFDGAQQNLNAGSIDGFDFAVITTEDLSANIDDFTVSDMPITSVPEPTAVFLTILSLPVILRRKRHA